ncbi:hypothetical protein [Aureimonas sp. AU12]|uniref:hypothetical protein n=1 Tax=Aureimonas sp. AU12 TaxID=1638161 RepID=UPI000A938790|nr:hypothetical protein [Aureimonas sp. AU12]
MKTYYVVQTYSVNAKRKIEADTPRQVSTESEALRLSGRLSETKFGVVAFSRTGDPESGDWEDAKILFQFGDFTQEDADAIRAAA